MERKLQHRIQRYGWDAASPVYDDAWADVLHPVHDALLELSDLRAGLDVIETASGSGLLTFRISELVGPRGSVMATDISCKMLEKAKAAAEEMNADNVTFTRSEAESLPTPDDEFDRAICALGLMYMPEPADALSEMARVVRHGARATALVWGRRRECGWSEIFPIVDAEVQSEVCPLFFGLGEPNALGSAMEAAGFQSVEEKRVSYPLCFPDRESVLNAVIDGGPVVLAAKRFTALTRKRVVEAFTATIEPYRIGDCFEIPAEFVLATGVMQQ